MKIGILTYHRAYNYGAVLQCYALQEVIKRMGYDVFVIDYRQPDIEKFYKFKSSFSIEKARKLSTRKAFLLFCLTPLRDIKNYFIHLKFKRIFGKFLKTRLILTDAYNDNIPDNFDRYIIGSDMLWSYDSITKEYDARYLGYFGHKPDAKVIGYAISGTPDSFQRLGEERKFDFYNNFNALSIREKTLASIVGSYTGKNVPSCIDPTLLTTKDMWADFSKPKWRRKKYLVTYYLRVTSDNQKAINEKVKVLAKNNGLEIVNIDAKGATMPLSVEDFVSVIKEAQYVITDSFHGVIFSLIFERPFHALKLYDSHDARYVDILHTVGADELAVDLKFIPFIPSVNYSVLNNRINDFRKSSIVFLKDNLE